MIKHLPWPILSPIIQCIANATLTGKPTLTQIGGQNMSTVNGIDSGPLGAVQFSVLFGNTEHETKMNTAPRGPVGVDTMLHMSTLES